MRIQISSQEEEWCVNFRAASLRKIPQFYIRVWLGGNRDIH